MNAVRYAASNGESGEQSNFHLAAHIHRIYAKHVLHFEWDERKARANLRRHRVSFDEAQTVFLDDRAILIDDPEHSDDEDRLILLGLSSNMRLLVVCHTYRRKGDVIRIISARRANAEESAEYEP